MITLYISGIDFRSGLIAKSLSDVNIIATINTETRQVLLVSTPRDFYVPLSISNGIPDKLTHAGIYGVDVSMRFNEGENYLSGAEALVFARERHAFAESDR